MTGLRRTLNPMLTIAPGRRRRVYELKNAGEDAASLRVARGLGMRGEISSSAGVWAIRKTSGRTVVSENGENLFELDEDGGRFGDTTIAWGITGAPWSLRARLGTGGRQIELEMNGRGPSATVRVSGDWEECEMVVLACFFAMLARRRSGILLISS